MLNTREYLTYSQTQLENLVKNGLADYTHGKKYQSIKGVMVLYLNFFTIQYDVATYSLATQKIVLTRPLWFIPPNGILQDFAKLCEKKRRENI